MPVATEERIVSISENALACGDFQKLRCAIVTAVFPPEFTFSGRVSEQIARALALQGCEVTVLAPFPNRPAGRLFPGYRRSIYRKEGRSEDFEVVHCFNTLSPQSGIWSRMLENVSFGLTSSLRLLTMSRPDVIYSNSWPILASGMMALVAKLRRIPFVVSVQDVYPESLVAQSRLTGTSLAARWMRRIDLWVSRQAAGLIVIGEGFQRLYQSDRGVPPARIHLVYNWGEAIGEQPDEEAGAEFRRQRSIPHDAFLAVYGGNIGSASGAEGLVEAFAQLGDLPAWLLIAGAGSQLEACRQRARRLGCDRVLFHSPWRQEETSIVLSAADVVLLPTVGTQSLASIPSKLISYFLMGKPVVAQVHPESETASMMKRADAGWILPPEDPALLAAKLRELACAYKGELIEKGRNGRRFAVENLCRDTNLPKVLKVLHAAAEGTAGGRSIA